MQIDRIFFPVRTLGFGERLAIWTVGCPHGCKGCSNPELQAPDSEREIPVEDILEIAKKHRNSFSGVTITGGDPFFQPEELLKLLLGLKALKITDILVYTGFTFEELSQMGETVKKALENTPALLDGRYIAEQNDNKGIRGSSNQRLYIFDESLKERYCGWDTVPRTMQTVVSGGKIFCVGIPLKVLEE